MAFTNEEIDNNPNMTPKEKKHAKLFNHEKILVKDMDDATLKAHIEELQDICFEGRSRLAASDEEARERAAKKKKEKGFRAVIAPDDFSVNAINNINERGRKLNKQEREIERLVSLGMARADAENLYKGATVVAIKNHGAGSVEVDKIVNATPTKGAAFVNPFAKKVEDLKPSADLQAAMDMILNPVSAPVVPFDMSKLQFGGKKEEEKKEESFIAPAEKVIEEAPKEEKKGFVSPFAK